MNPREMFANLKAIFPTLLIAAIVMIVNLLVDLTYGLINPRIRHQ